MTYTSLSTQDFLAQTFPFSQLSEQALNKWSERFTPLRYRIGQPIVVRDKLPAQVTLIYEGRARLLGYDPRNQMPLTLKILEPGELLGWAGLIRGIPCETAIASTEVVGLTLSGSDFFQLLKEEPTLTTVFQEKCSLAEVFQLLSTEVERRTEWDVALQNAGIQSLKELAQSAFEESIVFNLPSGKTETERLSPQRWWWVSGGGNLENFPPGSLLPLENLPSSLSVSSAQPVRLIGIVSSSLQLPDANLALEERAGLSSSESEEIPYADVEVINAPDSPPEADFNPYFSPKPKKKKKYPFVKGKGAINAPLACFQMLSKHFGMPFRRDAIQKILSDQIRRTGGFSMPLAGAVADLMGLNVQLAEVPVSRISQVPTPALIMWRGNCAVLYEINEREAILGVPEYGILRQKLGKFKQAWGEKGEVLFVQPSKQTPQKKFGLSWFLPAITRHRRVLLEVFLASFFVQLFALANPLMIQIIIDKVVVQNSPDTLHILGIFLVIVSVFEGLLTSFRTQLFADTTNRIDLSLGSEIIDHLLRLPLSYFEKRPVGELTSRVNELENIRSFLTGTGLTVVLDSIFSVFYIIIMFVYSPLLTLVALGIIPLFVGLTLVFSPIIRRQLRTKAERNAQTQSYLVEVLSGIQTVKAQNIELRSRWQWQDRYSRYVSAGFKTVTTSTIAGSASHFLNQLSALLILWVGAYLVLSGDLTLGQLIAFRIISGYVTGPLLRLAQLWQNFQETALSLERISDILDTPQEADEAERGNIPMPEIKGGVKFENVSFRFGKSGPLQLNNVSIDFPAGEFVGIVGQSGSGKSTMMKLLPRLYDPEAGRILIENYDISKVELYSLRRQIGIVPQETLLFDGTVQENIALTNPNASSEEIIAAAQAACAHEFIMGLPNGYNSRVGERGSALSGGQRQRIAIARTVLQNPNLLILDEATSALDYDTERQLCERLKEAFQGRTVFFITHRLSTIKSADRILVMDKGSVVEQGTHPELMAMQGRYFCLYQQQDSEV